MTIYLTFGREVSIWGEWEKIGYSKEGATGDYVEEFAMTTYVDSSLKKSGSMGGWEWSSNHRLYGTRENFKETQEHVYILQDWSKSGRADGREEVTEKNIWEEKGDGFRAQMEILGFSRSRGVSFIVSGGKKKPDQDAGGFVYLGRGDDDLFPSLVMKSQSAFVELSPLPTYWGSQRTVKKAGLRGRDFKSRPRWTNLLESHS